MACTSLTKGRQLDCNRVAGGVKFVYFAVYDQISSFAYDSTNSEEIDTIAFASSTDIYRYTVPRGSTSITDTITGSTENGTIFYAPALAMVLNRLKVKTQEQVKLLGQTQVVIFAQLNATHPATGNDVIMVLGINNGMQLNSGTEESGAAFGDRSGYTLNFDGLESRPMAMLEDVAAGAAPFSNAGITNLNSIISTDA
tara:strand:+ start:2182 stop:2775 length:594 start_codon:yes stop_codon:yes gene_type:complete